MGDDLYDRSEQEETGKHTGCDGEYIIRNGKHTTTRVGGYARGHKERWK